MINTRVLTFGGKEKLGNLTRSETRGAQPPLFLRLFNNPTRAITRHILLVLVSQSIWLLLQFYLLSRGQAFLGPRNNYGGAIFSVVPYLTQDLHLVDNRRTTDYSWDHSLKVDLDNKSSHDAQGENHFQCLAVTTEFSLTMLSSLILI